MSKKSKAQATVTTSTETPAAAPAPAATPAVSRETVMARRTVTLVKAPAADAKIAAQARVICAALKDGPLTETALIAALAAAGLKTVQTPKRIYTFYRKALVAGGYISLA